MDASSGTWGYTRKGFFDEMRIQANDEDIAYIWPMDLDTATKFCE